MLNLELHRKCLSYNQNLKLIFFVKNLIFMPLGHHAVWEVTITMLVLKRKKNMISLNLLPHNPHKIYTGNYV